MMPLMELHMAGSLYPYLPPLACLQVIAAADALMTFKLSIKL